MSAFVLLMMARILGGGAGSGFFQCARPAAFRITNHASFQSARESARDFLSTRRISNSVGQEAHPLLKYGMGVCGGLGLGFPLGIWCSLHHRFGLVLLSTQSFISFAFFSASDSSIGGSNASYLFKRRNALAEMEKSSACERALSGLNPYAP